MAKFPDQKVSGKIEKWKNIKVLQNVNLKNIFKNSIGKGKIIKKFTLFIPNHSESTFQRNMCQLHSFSHLKTKVARWLFTCAQF